MKRLFAIVLCLLLPTQGYAGALMSQMRCAGAPNSAECCQTSQDMAEPMQLCDSGVACQLITVCLPAKSPPTYASPTAAPFASGDPFSISRLVTDVWRPPKIV
ncbi:MAG: hypothetical protein WBD13_07835 [Burkholderiaceae bacterium]